MEDYIYPIMLVLGFVIVMVGMIIFELTKYDENRRTKVGLALVILGGFTLFVAPISIPPDHPCFLTDQEIVALIQTKKHTQKGTYPGEGFQWVTNASIWNANRLKQSIESKKACEVVIVDKVYYVDDPSITTHSIWERCLVKKE